MGEKKKAGGFFFLFYFFGIDLSLYLPTMIRIRPRTILYGLNRVRDRSNQYLFYTTLWR